MSQVEITNVGGPRPRDGVASEATLQELVRVLGKSGNTSGVQQVQQRYQQRLNTEIQATTGVFGKLKQSAKGLADEFVQGGDRISNYTQHVFKAGGVLQRLTVFADSLVDQFRSFSSVGASFNNSIVDMRSSALSSAMSLDSFQDLVMNNSQTLRLFGGSVTEGVKQFGRMSREFRERNKDFFDMGFTIEDINSGLLNYTELLIKTGRTDIINSRRMTTESAAYMKQLDMLSKATGQSRDALARQAEDINNDARMRALMARVSADDASNLSKNAASIMAFAPGLRETFLNLSTTGVAFDETSRILMSLGAEGQALTDLMANADNMSDMDFNKALAELGPAALEAFNRMFDPAVVASHDGLRVASDALAGFARMAGMDFDAIAKERNERDKLTSTFARFSQVIQELRSFIFEKLINSKAFEALTELGDKLMELVSPTDGVGSITGRLDGIFDRLFGDDGLLTKSIRSFTTFVTDPSFSKKVKNFVDTLVSVTEKIIEFFIGSEDKFDDRGRLVKEGRNGLFLNMFGAIESIFSDDPGVKRSIWQRISDGIKTILDALGKTIVETFDITMLSDEESPWDAITRSVQEGIISWLEGSETTDTSDFWNRAFKAVGDRILKMLDIERSTETIEIDTLAGPTEVEVPKTFWQTIYDTILKNLGLNQIEGEDKSLMERIGDKLADGWAEMWQGSAGQKMIETVSDMFAAVMDEFLIAISDIIPGYNAQEAKIRKANRVLAAGGELTPAEKKEFEELKVEQAYEAETSLGKQALHGATSILIGSVEGLNNMFLDITGLSKWLGNSNLTKDYDDWVRKRHNPAADNTWPTNNFDEFSGVTPETRQIGTLKATGINFEPKDTVAQIHAGERVLNPTETKEYNSNIANQSEMIKKLDQLNSTMATVASLLQQELAIQTRTLRGVSGLGTDLNRGIPR
jgi:hypothetical protein